MKKIYYIDNERKEQAASDLIYVQWALEHAGLPEDMITDVDIISDFYHMEKQEMYKFVFETGHCICTFSMYTATHYGSLYQILNMLKVGGISDIRNVIYYDTSGNLPKTLERTLDGESKNVIHILRAIETNYILTYQDSKCVRMRVDLSGDHMSTFRFEDVNLLELLQ